MEHTLSVIATVFKSNCYCHVLSGKHDVFADKRPNYKKKRKALHHLEKFKVLDKMDIGMIIAVVVGRYYGVNKSTIRYVTKNKDKMLGSIKVGAPTNGEFLV